MIPEKLLDRHQNATDAINRHIARYLQVGTIVRWKKGEFTGRRARVKHVIWDQEDYKIRILVETERVDRKGWIDTHPPHRYYLAFEGRFELIGNT